MKRGVWHQLGDKSQKIAIELLEQSVGVGVIISSRDLTKNNASDYASKYRNLGASVLLDQQFHVPGFTNKHMSSYGTDKFRRTISSLNKISDSELKELAVILRTHHSDLGADALIAPAVVYEAGRDDIVRTNTRLFSISKQVGDELGIPTYATVIVGHSATSSDKTIETILSDATALDCSGWYFGYEFGAQGQRIPNDKEQIYRFLRTGLTLACTGKPIIHCYSGPMALLSLSFGATGAAVGHAQNTWQFTRERWKVTTKRTGGNNDAPPRFFSTTLWGTIIYPDELTQLSPSLVSQVYTPSNYSPSTFASSIPWERWEANKHFLKQIATVVSSMAVNTDPRVCATSALNRLTKAEQLHRNIIDEGIHLKDGTNSYQSNWKAALEMLLANHSNDFEYLELLN